MVSAFVYLMFASGNIIIIIIIPLDTCPNISSDIFCSEPLEHTHKHQHSCIHTLVPFLLTDNSFWLSKKKEEDKNV